MQELLQHEEFAKFGVYAQSQREVLRTIAGKGTNKIAEYATRL